jgi:hypothetical protein
MMGREIGIVVHAFIAFFETKSTKKCFRDFTRLKCIADSLEQGCQMVGLPDGILSNQKSQFG